VLKVNKIFRDRPVCETFVIARTADEVAPFKALLNSVGGNPCVFNCFEILSNLKMLNLMRMRKSHTKVDDGIHVTPKYSVKHYLDLARKILVHSDHLKIYGSGYSCEKVSSVTAALEKEGLVGKKDVLRDVKVIPKGRYGPGSLDTIESNVVRSQDCIKIFKDK